MKNIIKLIDDAELNLGWLRGKGFGAVLLAIIALAIIYEQSFNPIDLIKSFKGTD